MHGPGPRGPAVVFALHNLHYRDARPFATADAVIVPSRFAADHYRKTLGLDCTVLSNLVDLGRVQVTDRDPRYLTFVNPSYDKGVHAFARIADELGQRRPDIPLLVVESRGSEATLVNCGIDLRDYGNVFLMTSTLDPRDFWRVTRVCLVPSLCEESQGLVAVEAMINGIPVIASDRGALPETLGAAGMALPLPERLTPANPSSPTRGGCPMGRSDHPPLGRQGTLPRARGRRAIAESRRWAPQVLEPRYAEFFSGLQRG